MGTIHPDAVLVDAEGEPAMAGLSNGGSYPAVRIRTVDPARILREPSPVESEGIAYILFTSGSTGVPKGVLIAFRCVSSFLAMMAERYSLNVEDRVAQPCDLSFDVSVSIF
jgi:D-alanine--poly(phosphoribitol) ligase subunit 1